MELGGIREHTQHYTTPSTHIHAEAEREREGQARVTVQKKRANAWGTRREAQGTRHKAQGTKLQGADGSGYCRVVGRGQDNRIQQAMVPMPPSVYTRYRLGAVYSDGWLLSVPQVPKHVAYVVRGGCGPRTHKRPPAAAVIIIRSSMAIKSWWCGCWLLLMDLRHANLGEVRGYSSTSVPKYPEGAAWLGDPI